MRKNIKDFLMKMFICIIVLTVPLMLCLYAVQAREFSILTNEIQELERKQEKLIEENKKLVKDIAILSSAERIEKSAVEELGMHKAEADDIVRVEMTGERK